MTDKEIKQKLKDASLYLSDASKRWSKHKDIAQNNVNGAMAVLDEIWDYVYRPMGEEVESNDDWQIYIVGSKKDNEWFFENETSMTDTVLGSMVNGF